MPKTILGIETKFYYKTAWSRFLLSLILLNLCMAITNIITGDWIAILNLAGALLLCFSVWSQAEVQSKKKVAGGIFEVKKYYDNKMTALDNQAEANRWNKDIK